MTKPAKLILTGGTLSSSRDAAGKLIPSATSLDDCIRRAGFDPDSAVRPYTIDSIDFDIDNKKHYFALRDSVLKVLDEGFTPVVCGGTDTLIWYSTLLTKDLKSQGRLQPGSEEKVIFLSSMKDFQKAPEHVKNIFKAGKLFAEQQMSGGFALCTEDEEGKRLAVHDVCNQFDKVSSSLTYAFRSAAPVGYISGTTFNPSIGYKPPPASEKTGLRTFYASIAPPLLLKHDSEMTLAYLKAMADSKPPFDGLIIEGMPGIGSRFYDADYYKLKETVRELVASGTRVVFCNPVRFDAESLYMKPVIDEKRWHPSAGLELDLLQAGAEFVTGLPKDVYLDLMLTTPARSHSRDMPEGPPHRRQKVLGIRYVPVSGIMQQSIATLAPWAKNLAFSALPHNVMPDVLYDTLAAHKQGTHYHTGFEYNGTKFITYEGNEHIEGPEPNPYKAGERIGELVTVYPEADMVTGIYNDRHKKFTAPTRTPPGTGKGTGAHRA